MPPAYELPPLPKTLEGMRELMATQGERIKKTAQRKRRAEK
jgi:hypothetical protein